MQELSTLALKAGSADKLMLMVQFGLQSTCPAYFQHWGMLSSSSMGVLDDRDDLFP